MRVQQKGNNDNNYSTLSASHGRPSHYLLVRAPFVKSFPVLGSEETLGWSWRGYGDAFRDLMGEVVRRSIQPIHSILL